MTRTARENDRFCARALALFFVLLLPFGTGTAASKAAAREFQKRVIDYLSLRNRVEGQLPQLKKDASAQEIALHRQLLGERIRAARSGARRGDIFFPAIRRQIATAIRSELRGPGSETARVTVMEGNPKVEGQAKVEVEVNRTYPHAAPVSSVPPTLLLKLPELPKDLEYRFVGHDLILHDAKASLIVDYIKDVVP